MADNRDIQGIINSRGFKLMAALDSNRNKDKITLANEIKKSRGLPIPIKAPKPKQKERHRSPSRSDYSRRKRRRECEASRETKVAAVSAPTAPKPPAPKPLAPKQPMATPDIRQATVQTPAKPKPKLYISSKTFYGLEKEAPESIDAPPPAPVVETKPPKTKPVLNFDSKKSRYETDFPTVDAREIIKFSIDCLLDKVKHTISHANGSKTISLKVQMAPTLCKIWLKQLKMSSLCSKPNVHGSECVLETFRGGSWCVSMSSTNAYKELFELSGGSTKLIDITLQPYVRGKGRVVLEENVDCAMLRLSEDSKAMLLVSPVGLLQLDVYVSKTNCFGIELL